MFIGRVYNSSKQTELDLYEQIEIDHLLGS